MPRLTNEEKKWKIMDDYSDIKFYVCDDDTQCFYEDKEIYMNEYEFDHCTNVILFDMLHEIGHVKKTKRSMPSYYGEYVATKWAIEHCKDYGIKVPEWRRKDFQRDVFEKRKSDNIINRLKHKEENLILKWEA